MLAAAVATPATTPGDLVLLQGLLISLWAPLQFLGACLCTISLALLRGLLACMRSLHGADVLHGDGFSWRCVAPEVVFLAHVALAAHALLTRR